LNVGVAGSEVVGLVPLASLLMAADYYKDKENLFILDEDQKCPTGGGAAGPEQCGPIRSTGEDHRIPRGRRNGTNRWPA
jgi:hypothetical protein